MMRKDKERKRLPHRLRNIEHAAAGSNLIGLLIANRAMVHPIIQSLSELLPFVVALHQVDA